MNGEPCHGCPQPPEACATCAYLDTEAAAHRLANGFHLYRKHLAYYA